MRALLVLLALVVPAVPAVAGAEVCPPVGVCFAEADSGTDCASGAWGYDRLNWAAAGTVFGDVEGERACATWGERREASARAVAAVAFGYPRAEAAWTSGTEYGTESTRVHAKVDAPYSYVLLDWYAADGPLGASCVTYAAFGVPFVGTGQYVPCAAGGPPPSPDVAWGALLP